MKQCNLEILAASRPYKEICSRIENEVHMYFDSNLLDTVDYEIGYSFELPTFDDIESFVRYVKQSIVGIDVELMLKWTDIDDWQAGSYHITVDRNTTTIVDKWGSYDKVLYYWNINDPHFYYDAVLDYNIPINEKEFRKMISDNHPYIDEDYTNDLVNIFNCFLAEQKKCVAYDVEFKYPMRVVLNKYEHAESDLEMAAQLAVQEKILSLLAVGELYFDEYMTTKVSDKPYNGEEKVHSPNY